MDTPFPGMTIEVARIGAEGEAVAVIDGFAPDPERLRAVAATLAYSRIGPHYPGIRAALPPDGLTMTADRAAWTIAHVFGHAAGAYLQESWFSLVTTPPASLAPIQRLPHFDGMEDERLAMIHYLSDDASGTAFYRHRATGFETVNAARYPAYDVALREDVRRHGLPPPAYIAGDTPIFERIATFAARANRALVYRGKMLHCADLGPATRFDADPLKGRLTVNSFLSPRTAP